LTLRGLRSEPSADLEALDILIQRFVLTRDPALIFQLSLAFSFVELQGSRYLSGPALPGDAIGQARVALHVLALLHEAAVLSQALASAVNRAFAPFPPVSPPAPFFSDPPPAEAEQSTGAQFLEQQFALADQTALAQLVRVLADANQTEQERLALLPVIAGRTEALAPTLTRVADGNARLAEVNGVLADLVAAAVQQPLESSEAADGPRELEELRAQEAAATASAREAEERYRTAVQRLRRIDGIQAGGRARALRAAAEALQASKERVAESVCALAPRRDHGGNRVVVTGPPERIRPPQREEPISEEELQRRIAHRRSIARAIIDILEK
jgi:hypothetical protein